jgi:hypothetical protein
MESILASLVMKKLKDYRVWNGMKVPGRQEIIEDNTRSLFEIIGYFSSSLISCFINLDKRFRPLAGSEFFFIVIRPNQRF